MTDPAILDMRRQSFVTADNPYNVNSFFAGIGGFDLGFERAGFATSFLCENNENGAQETGQGGKLTKRGRVTNGMKQKDG